MKEINDERNEERINGFALVSQETKGAEDWARELL